MTGPLTRKRLMPGVDRPKPSPPVSLSAPEEVIDRFEEAWGTGAAPRIEDYLSALTAADGSARDRRHVLEELVKTDLEYRWQQASRRAPTTGGTASAAGGPLLEEYLARFPELRPTVELIVWEYWVRQQ